VTPGDAHVPPPCRFVVRRNIGSCGVCCRSRSSLKRDSLQKRARDRSEEPCLNGDELPCASVGVVGEDDDDEGATATVAREIVEPQYAGSGAVLEPGAGQGAGLRPIPPLLDEESC
jgi:hypothetical protein